MSPCRLLSLSSSRVGLWEWFEYEHLDREVGVNVVVAHEADDLASGQLFDFAAHIHSHDRLPAAPEVEHDLTLTGGGERPFADSEAVLYDDEDAVVTERRLRLRWSAARRSGQRLDHGVRDRGRELAIRLSSTGAHRLAALTGADARSGSAIAVTSGLAQRGQLPTVEAFAEL